MKLLWVKTGQPQIIDSLIWRSDFINANSWVSNKNNEGISATADIDFQ
jgi:hypothetical protein